MLGALDIWLPDMFERLWYLKFDSGQMECTIGIWLPDMFERLWYLKFGSGQMKCTIGIWLPDMFERLWYLKFGSGQMKCTIGIWYHCYAESKGFKIHKTIDYLYIELVRLI